MGENLNNLSSYVSASNFPVKLLHLGKEDIVDSESKKIKPLHIQIIPTNRCNSNCSWCSCSKVDRSIEMPIEEIKDCVDSFSKLGTKCLTITGGGEPTLHKNFIEIIEYCNDLDLEIGLVTNGKLLFNNPKLLDSLNHSLKWLRLSITEDRPYPTRRIDDVCKQLPLVDIGISFTINNLDDLALVRQVSMICRDTKNITHARFVQNILNPIDRFMFIAEDECKKFSDKLIFQYRSAYTKGQNPCLISFLKPVIDATGNIYPCCGTQYATDETRLMPEKMSMGNWRDFIKMSYFDGSICKKCYYSNYNEILKYYIQDVVHERFV